MAVPSILPLMILAFFSSFKCCEIVGCANGNSFTISPHIHVSTDNKYSTIAMRAGCESALNKLANSLCFSEKEDDFEEPISTRF